MRSDARQGAVVDGLRQAQAGAVRGDIFVVIVVLGTVTLTVMLVTLLESLGPALD